MYRLLIADDEESIREGVADFVRQNCPEWDVAALARDGREALALARGVGGRLFWQRRTRAYDGHPFCQDEKTRLPAEMLRLDS